MTDESYDLIIIGAGPGGYVAAIRAAQLGLKTAVAERKHLGGICLNWGCIPTKSLLRTGELYRQIVQAKAEGLTAENVGFDTARVVGRSRQAATQLSRGVDGLLKKNRVAVLWGNARIAGPGIVEITETDATPPRGAKGAGTYDAKNLIIATGARPRVLPGLEPDGEGIWTYFEAMAPAAVPASLAIVGSGAIGVEFASFYRSLGAEVTLLEALPRILPAEDEEIVALADKRFRKDGIAIHTGSRVTGAVKRHDAIDLSFNDADGNAQTATVERVISAVGVVGNVEGFGLEELGVEMRDGAIAVDGLGRTNIEGVFAIGDVAGAPMLAHKAQHEGIVCVEAIAGGEAHELDRGLVPSCTYSHPQIASVGITEAEAAEQGLNVRIGRFPLIGNGKAVVAGDTGGMVKTIFEAGSGRLLGAHLVGPEVTELIQGFVIAMNAGATEEQLRQTIFPHPTLSEAMHESILAADGRALHI